VGAIEFGASWQAGGKTRMRLAFAHKTSRITLRYYYNFMPPGWLECARRADHGDMLVGSIFIVSFRSRSKDRRESSVYRIPDGICAAGRPRPPHPAWAEWLTARIPAGNPAQIVLGFRPIAIKAYIIKLFIFLSLSSLSCRIW
jgi:hypothetical protein